MANPLLNLSNPPRVKASASSIVYETLREAILTNEIPAGTQLVEATLAQQFGISKTPVREALQQLVHSGLATSELAKGVMVHRLTLAEIQDVVEMRLVLEPLALRQSVPNLSAEDFDLLQNTLQQAQDAFQQQDFKALSKLNSLFHSTLSSRATNHLLLRWLDSLSDHRRLITMQGWAIDNRSGQEYAEHQAILAAAMAGEAEQAAILLAKHISGFAEIALREKSE